MVRPASANRIRTREVDTFRRCFTSLLVANLPEKNKSFNVQQECGLRLDDGRSKEKLITPACRERPDFFRN